MKKLKKKIFIGALAASGALTFTACTNRPECVYGPPPEIPAEIEETISEAESTKAQTAKTTGAEETDFDVNGNIPEDVYGPPSYWEEEIGVEDVTEGESSGEEESFDETDNVPVCVYGPPEYFENDDESVSTPLETVTIEGNVPVCVYGPPQYFENKQ